MEIKIIKPQKQDVQEFVNLRREYLEIINQGNKVKEKIDEDKIKKEFISFFEKNKIIFFAKINKDIAGYIAGMVFKNVWTEGGYIDDLYVSKEFRRKKIGKKLVKAFLDNLKAKKIFTCQLGVSIKNKKAINLYKKLGFKLVHYEMGIKLK